MEPRQFRTQIVVVFVVVAFLVGLGVGFAVFRPVEERPTIIWTSTQLAPPAESDVVFNEILPAFERESGVIVKFVPEQSYATFEDRLVSQAEAGDVRVTVAGGLHGDFTVLTERGFLTNLDGTSLPDRTFIPGLWELSRTPAGEQFFVPWMQATYALVVNEKAMPYLPDGADVNALTFAQLKEWAQNIADATTMDRPVGIPKGPGGLYHRFVHGYMYPSFTGKSVGNFNTPEAVAMWEFMRDELWPLVHPSSPTWDAMDAPLLAEDVWIAWEHQARFRTAITTSPDDFRVVPTPAADEGRGFIAVVAGLAILEGAPRPDLGRQLIEYLTRPSVQALMAEEVGFFPVVEEAQPDIEDPAIAKMAEGITRLTGADDAILATIPGGLGARAGDFTRIYREAFDRILIDDEAIPAVLTDLDAQLQELYGDTGAEFPLPG